MKINKFEYPQFLYELTINSNSINDTRCVYVYSDLKPKLFLNSIDSSKSNYILMNNPNTYKHKFIATKDIIEINEIDPFNSTGSNRQYKYILSSNNTCSLAYRHVE